MHVVISDIHFGRESGAVERNKERDLIACLRSLEDGVQALVLLGDIFDYYVEYPTLIPKGFLRFQALLAEWADSGVRIVYLAGNHDPWHIDYYRDEVGAEVYFDEVVVDIYGRRCYLHHGDGIAAKSRVYRRIRYLLRHPLPVWLYKHLIPADAGLRLARYVSRNYAEETVDLNVAGDLRQRAKQLLEEENMDLVIMGHSHFAEISHDGRYMNPGSWHDSRTLLRIDPYESELLRWNGTRCKAYQAGESPSA